MQRILKASVLLGRDLRSDVREEKKSILRNIWDTNCREAAKGMCMRVLVDSNIIIDIITKREPFAEYVCSNGYSFD